MPFFLSEETKGILFYLQDLTLSLFLPLSLEETSILP
jgi:hypothetical protein